MNQAGARDRRARDFQAAEVYLGVQALEPIIRHAIREFSRRRLLVPVGPFVEVDLDDTAERLQAFIADEGAQPIGRMNFDGRLAAEALDLGEQDAIASMANGC